MGTDKYSLGFIYLFIQCGFTVNTFFLSARFSRAAHEHVVTGLKI